MLASNPTSGLSLVVMIEREESRNSCVDGPGRWERSSDGSLSRLYSCQLFSKRFGGLSLAPRPRMGGNSSSIAEPSGLSQRERVGALTPHAILFILYKEILCKEMW